MCQNKGVFFWLLLCIGIAVYLCGYCKIGKSTPTIILTRVILSFSLCAGEAVQEMSRDSYIGVKKQPTTQTKKPKTPQNNNNNHQKTTLPYLTRSVL